MDIEKKKERDRERIINKIDRQIVGNREKNEEKQGKEIISIFGGNLIFPEVITKK